MLANYLFKKHDAGLLRKKRGCVFQIQLNMCSVITLGKWQGDCNIQGELKIFGSCLVTVIYRVTTIHTGPLYKGLTVY